MRIIVYIWGKLKEAKADGSIEEHDVCFGPNSTDSIGFDWLAATDEQVLAMGAREISAMNYWVTKPGFQYDGVTSVCVVRVHSKKPAVTARFVMAA